MRRITVHEVTATKIYYTVELYTPLIGWDGMDKTCTHVEWRSRYPYHTPKKGQQFTL